MSINNKLNYFLMMSMPILLIVGPFLSDLVIVIFFLSALILIFRRQLSIEKNLKKFIYIFLVFYLIGLLSSSLSIEKFISLKSSIPYLRYLGFVLVAYYLYNTKKGLVEKLGIITICIFLIFFIDSILFFLFGFNIPIEKMANDRFSSFFGDEKVLGGYVARLVPLGLIYISSINNQNQKKFFYLLYLLLASYLILLSGERTALVIFFVELLIIIIFFSNLRKILITFFSIILIFSFLLIYFSPNEKFSKPFERIVLHSMKQLYFNDQKFSFFSARHEDHYKTAINIFSKKTFLGGGNKSFRFMCSMEDYSVRKDVDERYTEYAQYDDYIIIIKVKNLVDGEDNFKLYYKNNQMHHNKNVFNVGKLKDFVDKPLYVKQLKIFDGNKISNKNYLNLNNSYVKKNQKLFLYDGQIYFRDGCNTHPHHIYLQIASENGIINLLIIIFLLFYIIIQFVNLHKKKYKDKFNSKEVLLLLMIFIQILPFLPSGNFFNNWLSIFFFLPIGFYLALKDNLE